MSLSRIQNHIISRLKNADSLRFSELKPSFAANDLFNYHLKFLCTKGLVEKHPDGYRLSQTGKKYVADVHHTSDQSQRLFKFNAITIVSRKTTHGIEILTQRRTAQPSFGKRGAMGGTILKGESLLDGAARKLLQETGVTASFRYIGTERRFTYVNNRLFSDVLFPICYADTSNGEPISTEYGENYWESIDQAIINEQNPYDSIASIVTVLRAIKDGTIDQLPAFYTETTQRRVN